MRTPRPPEPDRGKQPVPPVPLDLGRSAPPGIAESLAICGSVALGVLAATEIPHTVATHPVLGLGVVAVIPVAVSTIVALASRSIWRWFLFGALTIAAVVVYALGREEHDIGSLSRWSVTIATAALVTSVALFLWRRSDR